MTNIPVHFRVARLNESIETLKPDFEEYLKDKSFSLEERWDTFSMSPLCLSNFSNQIPTFVDSYLHSAFVNALHEHFLENRGVTISVFDLVDMWEGNEFVEPLKEAILEANIKQFTYNWKQ